MKAFDDFKNKQKTYEVMFLLYVKYVYYEVYLIPCTLR